MVAPNAGKFHAFMTSRSHSGSPALRPLFGLRLEDLVLQLTIARPMADGRYELSFDKMDSPPDQGFLTGGNSGPLIAALEQFCERHGFQRGTVAVSLDGDYCVTRVTSGTQDEVQRDLGMLAGRVPRYLQLGPGKKVTGGVQSEIESGMFYAATSVGNGELIEMIYDALAKFDLNVVWVEPSLNGLARLVGHDARYQSQPVLIADGTGRRWDVGVVNGGRLLLDYRASNSDTIDGIFAALDGHLERLRRFCHRHRKLASGNIEHMLVCGNDSKVDDAVATLGRLDGIETRRLGVPDLSSLFTTREPLCDDQVTAVAAVLPLVLNTPQDQVPDLLEQVRRPPRASLLHRTAAVAWPMVAAVFMVIVTTGWREVEYRRFEAADAGRSVMESELNSTQVQFAKLASSRRRLQNLARIEALTSAHDWGQLSQQLFQCLSPSTKLNSFVVSGKDDVSINGETIDDASLYDLIGSIRQIAGVREVALKGTTPAEGSYGSQFVLEVKLTPFAVPAHLDGDSVESPHDSEWDGDDPYADELARSRKRTPRPHEKQRRPS